MKVSIDKNLKCNRYSVMIKFKEFGSTALTPEDEQKLIDDFCPMFRLSDLILSGKYKIENGKIIADNAGEDVTLSVPNREIAINELLEVGCTFHVDEISDKELKANLKTKDLMAKAKIQLFVDKVTGKIDEILKELAKSLDNFEKTEEIEIG